MYGRQLAIYQRAAKEALGLDAAALLIEMRTGAVHLGEVGGWTGVEDLLMKLVSGNRAAPAEPPCWGCAYWRSCPSSRGGRGDDGSPGPAAQAAEGNDPRSHAQLSLPLMTTDS